MSTGQKVKFLFRKSDETGFRTFRRFLFVLLDISGLNVLRQEFFVGVKSQKRTLLIFCLFLLSICSSILVVCKYFGDIEEVITGTITFIMLVQLIAKMVELVVHRADHRQLFQTVEKKTKSLENDREYRHIGLKHFKSARTYIQLSTAAYLAALASLVLYPLYAVMIVKCYKLAVSIELPGTNHTAPTGWLMNYIYISVVASIGCFIILGENVERGNFLISQSFVFVADF